MPSLFVLTRGQSPGWEMKWNGPAYLYKIGPRAEYTRGTKNYAHSPSWMSTELMRQFVVDVARWREDKPGFSPEHDWPYRASWDSPRAIERNPVACGLPETGGKEGLIYFPSTTFAKLWLRIPGEIRTETLTAAGKSEQVSTVQAFDPLGAVLWCQEYGDAAKYDMEENMYYLAERGFHAYALQRRNISDMTPGEISVVATALASKNPTLPLYVVGFSQAKDLVGAWVKNAVMQPEVKGVFLLGDDGVDRFVAFKQAGESVSPPDVQLSDMVVSSKESDSGEPQQPKKGIVRKDRPMGEPAFIIGQRWTRRMMAIEKYMLTQVAPEVAASRYPAKSQ